MLAQKAQFGAQALNLPYEIEHSFDQCQIQTVPGAHLLYASNGMDRFFREYHNAVRRLISVSN
jgi:hypothetical protein